MTTIPRQNDVLFGKGSSINTHHGNKKLRGIVEQHRETFLANTKKGGKREIAINIFNDIENSGGRFLTEDASAGSANYRPDAKSNSNGSFNGLVTDRFILKKVWVIVDKNKAIDKVMHRLREKQTNGSTSQKPKAKKKRGERKSDSGGQGKMKSNGNVPETSLAAISNGLTSPSVTSGSTTTSSTTNVQPNILQQIQAQQMMRTNLNPTTSALAAFPSGANSLHSTLQQSASAIPPASMGNNSSTALPFAASSQSIMNPSFAHLPMAALSQSSLYPLASSLIFGQNSSMEGIVRALLPPSTEPSLQSLAAALSSTKNLTQIAPASSTSSLAQSQVSHPIRDIQSMLEAPSNRSLNAFSIAQWLRLITDFSPSSENYIKEAVNLSLILTEHLMQLVESRKIKLPDIIVENVVLFADSTTTGLTTHSSLELIIKDVQFQSGTVHFPTAVGHHQSQDGLCSHAVCTALGHILLEVFSKGRSKLTGILCNATNCIQYVNATVPPDLRQEGPETPNCSLSMTANTLLLGAGMPMSVCRLVCDLLNAASTQRPENAITTLDEVLWDLTQMKEDPDCFLFDRMSPQKSVDDACLFHNMDIHMFGRVKEIEALTKIRENISKRFQCNLDDSVGNAKNDESVSSSSNENNFHSESVFLSGYAGSGKSSLLQALVRACEEDKWFMISGKYDSEGGSGANTFLMATMLDKFFRKWSDESLNLDPAMKKSFHQVCRSLRSSIDDEGLAELLCFLPSLSGIFPEDAQSAKSRSHDKDTSSIEKVGSARKRRIHLLSVVTKCIAASGRPLLVAFDDLQWANPVFAEGLKYFNRNFASVSSDFTPEMCHGGVLYAGTYRSNEVEDSDELIKTIKFLERSNEATTLAVGELTKDDVTRLLSRKLCLPLRYTLDLAGLVISKTRGNPFFIVQFLRSIIQNKMLLYSTRSCCWTWDLDTIDMQMIPDGVAELLTAAFNRLPRYLMQTVQIASCFGLQVDITILDLLRHILPDNLQEALQLATEVGIMERAGPIYQFTHDLIYSTIFDSIPLNERAVLHKTIGEHILRHSTNNPIVHSLAVDQTNLYIKDATATPEEKPRFASINTAAAKFAMSEGSFEKAQPYVEVGMKMLADNHWESQYQMSLDLYEMSASISCMTGDISTMSYNLNEIMAHAKSFEDSLTSKGLLSKLLASSSKYDEAMATCLEVLVSLGEEFPKDITLPIVLSELSVIQTTLTNISVESVKLLPLMTSKSKLNAMKFLSMLCSYAIISKPFLVPILACRMVRLTIENGFCDDSIVGLVTAGFGLFTFADDVQMGYNIGKVAETLIEESPNRHALSSRLCVELDGVLKLVVEPAQNIRENLVERYNSAIMNGDVIMALRCRLLCCGACPFEPLVSLLKQLTGCIKQSAKLQDYTTLYSSMAIYQSYFNLAGHNDEELTVKSYDELKQIGIRSNNARLLYQVSIYQAFYNFYMGNYLKVVELCDHQQPVKRASESFRLYILGISSFILARQTNQSKYINKGEYCAEKMLEYEEISTWNFSSMSNLLQAERHHMNGDYESAKAAYDASAESARTHKFLHHEAVALELYGIFCVENQNHKKGVEKIQLAIDRYAEWGALNKVISLQKYVDNLNPSHSQKKLKRTPDQQ